MGEKLYTPALRKNKKRCRKRGSAMYRNLKSFDFIITAGIFVYSAWSLLEMSVDVCATLEKLALFAWGIIGCMRIDKKNRKKQNEDA